MGHPIASFYIPDWDKNGDQLQVLPCNGNGSDALYVGLNWSDMAKTVPTPTPPPGRALSQADVLAWLAKLARQGFSIEFLDKCP